MDTDDIPIEELREENEKYKHQMDQLNKDIDKMLRNHNAPKRKKLIQMSPELAAATKKNETLRKDRLRLYGEATHSDTSQRIQELGNKIGHVEVQIEQKQSEIKGLENIKKNQEHVVEMAKHNEEEMRYLQDEHRVEMNEFREKYHLLTQDYKVEERNLNLMQARYHNALERIKLDIDRDGLEELEEVVRTQQDEIDTLQEKVDSLSTEASSHRKQQNRKQIHVEKDTKALQKRIEYLDLMMKDRERELKRSYANTKM